MVLAARPTLAEVPLADLSWVASHTKGKGPQPFMVGEKKELGPQVTGLLVLRVNAPPGAKCVGRLKVRLSGNFTELAR
jgi:hypothetical protein